MCNPIYPWVVASPAYHPTTRDKIAVRIANLFLRLTTTQKYRELATDMYQRGFMAALKDADLQERAAKVRAELEYQLPHVGPGWHRLIIPLIRECIRHGGKVDQIKEKFGGLRFYYSEPMTLLEWSTPEREEDFWTVFRWAVSRAEGRSLETCEDTGEQGWPHWRKEDGVATWMRTLSPERAAELGYKVEPPPWRKKRKENNE